MSKVSSTKVLSAITSVPLSATGIAKKIGMSKGSQIQDVLDELVDSGDIQIDNSGRFPVYTKVKKAAVVKKDQSAAKASEKTGECKVIPDAGDTMTDVTVDPEVYQELDGYKIVKPAKNKSGQVGARVTLPIVDQKTGKNKTVFVKQGMTLVIINDKPCYMVDTPARLIIACHTYAKENGLSTYAIKQAHVGVINGENDIKMSDVVIMKIEAINKGA